MVKKLPAMQETQVQFLGQEEPLEEGIATHSSILAWRIPWTEEPGGLQSMQSQRVRNNWATKHSTVLVNVVNNFIGNFCISFFSSVSFPTSFLSSRSFPRDIQALGREERRGGLWVAYILLIPLSLWQRTVPNCSPVSINIWWRNLRLLNSWPVFPCCQDPNSDSVSC